MSQPGKGFLVWLAGLSVLGFLATDMYLPAFAAMQQDLNTSAASISASLSLVPRRLRSGASCSGGRSRTVMDVSRSCCSGWRFCRRLSGHAVGARCHPDAGAALYSGGRCLCRRPLPGRRWSPITILPQRTNRIFATIMPLVGLSPALAPLLGSWILVHFEWQAISPPLFAITLVLMLPALRA